MEERRRLKQEFVSGLSGSSKAEVLALTLHLSLGVVLCEDAEGRGSAGGAPCVRH